VLSPTLASPLCQSSLRNDRGPVEEYTEARQVNDIRQSGVIVLRFEKKHCDLKQTNENFRIYGFLFFKFCSLSIFQNTN